MLNYNIVEMKETISINPDIIRIYNKRKWYQIKQTYLEFSPKDLNNMLDKIQKTKDAYNELSSYKFKKLDIVTALIDFKAFKKGTEFIVDYIDDNKYLCFKQDLNEHGFHDVTYNSEYFKLKIK